MARRMDRKVIKLEAAFGSDRQAIVVKRNQDLVVADLMQDVERTFKIPMNEQVIFHKGTSLCDYPNEKLEALGVENNHSIRITRDPDLPNRSPRPPIMRNLLPNGMMTMSRNGRASPPATGGLGGGGGGGGGYGAMNSSRFPNSGYAPNPGGVGGLDPVSYLKEISPQRVPDPTPYQMQIYNQNLNNNSNQNGPNDVIKLYVSYGSEKEYILVHGKKPLSIMDLKRELNRLFKIPPDQQCIVFKGYNLHEYTDEAPLEAFGMENNSPISVWPRSSANNMDMRLPVRGPTPPPMQHNQLADAFVSPRGAPPLSGRWDSTLGDSTPHGEVMKIEIQHGSDRHMLLMKGKPTCTVLDLQNELERLTSVAVRDQKLFFKSQQLELTPYKTLRECEVENNNVVKLIGEPSKIRYSNYFGRMPVALSNPNDPNQRPFGGGPGPQQQQQQQQQQPLNGGYQPSFSQNY